MKAYQQVINDPQYLFILFSDLLMQCGCLIVRINWDDPKTRFTALNTAKSFKLNYRIADKSSKTLNKIGFRLYYYKTRKDIPAALLKQIEAKKKLVLFTENDTDPYKVAYTVSSTTNSVVAQHGAGETRCRPPYIIVTGK